MGDGCDPLGVVLGALDASEEWCSYVAGKPSDPAGWIRIDEVLADDSIVAGWLGGLLDGPAQGNADVAGSYLSAWLGGLLVAPMVATAVLRGRAWPLAADSVAVRHNPGGWFDGMALLRSDVVALPNDPDAGHPHVRGVADRSALYVYVVDEVVALSSAVFAQIRSFAPFGTAGMWGALADAIAEKVLARAGRDGGDAQSAWHEAAAVLDLLAERVPVLRTRPTLAQVEWSGGAQHVVVRGSCCLYHKVSGRPLDPCGEAYCLNCPKRDPVDRLRRWAAGLDAAVVG